MVKPQLLSETPMSLVEVKAEIERIKQRDPQLNFRTGKCEEYVNDIVSLSAEQASAVRKKLRELGISRLKEEHIIKVVDLLPKTPEDVRIVLQGSASHLAKKDLEQIAAAVAEAAG